MASSLTYYTICKPTVGGMCRAVMTWIRDLLAGVGLCESSVDRKVREARAAFRSAINSNEPVEPGD